MPNRNPAILKALLTGCTASALLVSCGAVDAVKSSTAKVTAKATAGISQATAGISQFSLADLRPSKIDVVEVREKDLRELPSGKDRALAFDLERKRSFWSFLPGSFKEPSLPAIEEGEIDGSLLPPKPL